MAQTLGESGRGIEEGGGRAGELEGRGGREGEVCCACEEGVEGAGGGAVRVDRACAGGHGDLWFIECGLV